MAEYVSPTIGEIGNGGEPGLFGIVIVAGPVVLLGVWLVAAAHNMVGLTTIGVAGMVAAVYVGIIENGVGPL
ncbi:MAG: hypothetical protein FWD92_05370 [Methanomassiliicoccaceae archaeon]|nr:hypothetical protein [Methanomassiliicoccaceae archaeon]